MGLHLKYFLGQVYIAKDDGTLLEITDQLQALENLADELAALNGLTASVTELNYLDNATVGGLVASKAVVRDAAAGIPLKTLAVAAAGNSQGTAAALTADVNIITGADNTTAVKLPVAVIGQAITVVNSVANKTLPVYPATGAQINGGGANAAFTLGPGQAATFHCTALLTWYARGQAAATPTTTELAFLAGATVGTQVASKAIIADTNINQGIAKVTALHIGATGTETQVTATGAELNLVDNQVAAAVMTVGAENGGNTIVVGIQLNDAAGAAMATRSSVFAYLSDDANGDSVAATAPNGGVVAGTDGELLGNIPALSNAVIVHGNLAIDAVPEKFKTTQAMAYALNGVLRTKAASIEQVFSAAHVITASKFGIIAVQIDAAGNISTKVPASPQAYDDAPAALAALPAADAGNVRIGYIAIENNAGDWTANTDDMTNASDLTTAAFTDTTEVVPTTVPKSFWLTSEADGDIDVAITDSGAPTYYLAVVLPNGKLNVSGAITFA